MKDLASFTEPDKPKLTVAQMQRAVYRVVRDTLRKAQEEAMTASLHLAESEMRLQNAKEEDDQVGWNRDVQALEKQVRDANSRLSNRMDNRNGWEEILDFVVNVGLGAKPSKVDYPFVENGSGI
jgi:uncharacterized protein (DUF2267 family)